MSIYTKSERTEKKYTVYQAVQSARRRLGPKRGLCVNALNGLPDCHKITLEELNELQDKMYWDSLYCEI